MLWLGPNNAIECHENQLIGETAIINKRSFGRQPSGCFLFLQSKKYFWRSPMQFHFGDLITAANLFVLLGIYRKMSIVVYQHKLMWADFAERKGISPNGKHAASA
jgi:hypothetical protein